MHPLRLTSPPMKGAEHLQHSINHRLQHWGAPADAGLKVDGLFGKHTHRRAHEVAFGMGIRRDQWQPRLTIAAQEKIEDFGRLTHDEVKLHHEREAWRHRYVKRLKAHDRAIDHAVAFALHMAKKRIVEHPMGSNLGPYITSWERLAGYNVPAGGVGVPWCGCWCNAVLVAGGFHAPVFAGIGYVPAIEAHAKAGIDGWRWHGLGHVPVRGSLATFGVVEGDHVEFVVDNGHPLRTVGGNTSEGNGSPNNGGGLYYHNFRFYHGLPLRGYAVPPWAH